MTEPHSFHLEFDGSGVFEDFSDPDVPFVQGASSLAIAFRSFADIALGGCGESFSLPFVFEAVADTTELVGDGLGSLVKGLASF